MKSAPRLPIEQLCRDLHGQILRVLQPPGAPKPLPWREFARRAKLDNWSPQLSWKLREGELKWGPDRLIEVAGNLGIRTEIVVVGPDTDSLLARHEWPPHAPEGQGNAPEGVRFAAPGTATPTTAAA